MATDSQKNAEMPERKMRTEKEAVKYGMENAAHT